MKGLRLYFIGSALIVVFYLVAQYYKPQPTDWTASYLKEDKIPFGLYILDHELESIFPNAKLKTSRLPVYNTLKDKNFKNTNYIFIAGKLKLDELDYIALIKFMRAGNHVFIASYDFGKVLNKKLKISSNSSLNFAAAKSSAIHFVNPALDSTHQYHLNKELGHQFFDKADTALATTLGKDAKGRTNFLKYTYGKGALYILPDPQLFTNFNLLNPEGAAYAAKALSYLPESENLILDENNTVGNIVDTSVLRVIFAHKPLAWAYNLSIIGLLLFVFFEMKRRQRIIPIIVPLKNSSVGFVTVVGKVYYQQRDNRDITQKKITYFLEYVRSAYRLKTAKLDEELSIALIAKSGADEDTVRELFNIIHTINTQNWVTDNQLITLNKLIEKFYKQAQ